MNFKALQTKVEKLEAKPHAYRGVISRVSNMIDLARINADDTVAVTKEGPEAWDVIAQDSLESLLCYSDDKAVAAWFRKQGIRW